MNWISCLRVVAAVTACSIAAATAGTAWAKDEDSGFLPDYSRLEEKQDDKGKPYRIWVSPKLTPRNYHTLIVDPIVFYPEPRPSEKVSAQALKDILTYTNDLLRHTLSRRGVKLVDRPGPGAAKLRIAITSVVAKEEGLAPHQYIPIAFLLTMASRAASGTPERARLVVETEVRDSVTGELLGLKVRVGTGERLAEIGEQKVITLETVKPILDEIAEHGFEDAPKYIQTK